MKIIIQNMVSRRCKMMVKSELDKLGIAYTSIELGEVRLTQPISENLKLKLQQALHLSGLELLYDKRAELIEKIISIIVEMIHYSKEIPEVNFSTLLSERLKKNYHYLAEIFSKTKGITIEHFIIQHKVEKIKELILYGELNLTEISYLLHYSSVSYLSKQFKQVTGLTPTFFKKLRLRNRKNLEDL